MKYYLTQAGVNFIQEGVVKTKNKAKKREWVKQQGIKKVIANPTKEPSYREIISSRKSARHGGGPAATVVIGREK